MGKLNGILRAEGRKIVDGQGNEVLLTGWGLGNWLLQEGYMWLAGGPRFDRPRRIENTLEELAGKEYMKQFWQRFREDYIRKEDIQYMAQLGYNSIRIPINWRVLMEEGPGIVWKEDGFRLLDNCFDWCDEVGLYVFLDLHGAPGGQTGANIDDSIDDVPRLFIDKDNKEKALALWKELAIRYHSRESMAGYDLLNEPIAPSYSPDRKDFDYLLPELKQFYRDATAVIREVDQDHLISIEGMHWSTDVQVFEEKYDDNMVLHLHRYAEIAERKILDPFIQKSEEWDIPLWLGETGENLNEWYAALYPLAESLGIGYNIWPWKKMECTNSPCSINKPADYDLLMEYVKGGPHPGFEKAQEILDEYLENIRLENCTLRPEVTNHVFRQVPFSMRATDFDEVPGKGISFSGSAEENPQVDYRTGCGMKIVEKRPAPEKRFAFDCAGDRFALVLSDGEFAEYTISGSEKLKICLEAEIADGSVLEAQVKVDGKIVAENNCDSNMEQPEIVFDQLPAVNKMTVRLTAKKGTVELERINMLCV